MSKTDTGVGLGWEVWFLLAVLAAGGFAVFLATSFLGGGLEPGAASVTGGDMLQPAPQRLLIGVTVASALTWSAISLIRSTAWSADKPPAGEFL